MGKSKFGEVRDIKAVDYVQEGIPLCALLNEYMNRLATCYLETKFLQAISTTYINNYLEKNLPTIFAYYESTMKRQLVGLLE